MLGLDAKVLPLVTTTLEVAEQIRTRLMGAHSKLAGGPEYVSAVFSGKEKDGSKRTDHGARLHFAFGIAGFGERGKD